MIGLVDKTTLRLCKKILLLAVIGMAVLFTIFTILSIPHMDSDLLVITMVPTAIIVFIATIFGGLRGIYLRLDFYKFKISRAISIKLKQKQCYSMLSQKQFDSILSIDEINLTTRHYSKALYNPTDLNSVRFVITLLLNQIPHLDEAMQTDVAYKIVSILHHYVIFYENYDFALSENDEDIMNRCFEFYNLDLHILLTMIYAYTGDQKYQSSIETFLNVNNFQAPFNHLKVLEHVSSKQSELAYPM